MPETSPPLADVPEDLIDCNRIMNNGNKKYRIHKETLY
jgi:hypothetical protein